MNHFIVIESNTTGTGAIIIENLLSHGNQVSFLTRAPAKYPFLSTIDPRLKLVEVDTNSFPAVMRAIQELQARGNVNAVSTSSEFYVPIAAQVAAALGLPGLDPVAARICRHKPSTRQRLRDAGLL